ncbi:MAG: 16S rRNA (cytosine(1402)-N(4))-methyltransferase RsmH, partial [Planctomycetota bacterium]
LEPRSGGRYLDLTLGAGGHARALLERSAPDGFLAGLDRDEEILIEARRYLESFNDRCLLRKGNFSEAAMIFEEFVAKADGVIMDLGLSSLQLDHPDRGFSIFRDGPLDFRMDATQPFSARELVNRGHPDDLYAAIRNLGEEPKARAIVKAIVEERRKRPLLHTSDLRRLVEQVYGRKGGKIHPATRTFQGLRMEVNQELESLAKGLIAAFSLLAPGGRLAVISFHSGEDRVVKTGFNNQVAKGSARLVNRKPIMAGRDELRRNRRSRSARLRLIERL